MTEDASTRPAPRLLSFEELEQAFPELLDGTQESGILNWIFLRPKANERLSVAAADLSPEGGIEGDRWATDHCQGRSDPQSQVSVMNSRILQLIAGDESAISLAGDNLIVDLDLSERNFPAGSQIQIGTAVVLEFTAQAHTGCRKFAIRYGQQARDFINGAIGRPLNLRGRYARVIQGGTIQVGDSVAKVAGQ